jgi:hypothetical protein
MYPQILHRAQSSGVDGNAVAPIHRGGWRAERLAGESFCDRHAARRLSATPRGDI